MKMYKFNTTKTIADAFKEYDLKYEVFPYDDIAEILSSGFSVECGPNIEVQFIITEDDNSIFIRTSRVVSHVPKEKRVRAIEVCNAINQRYPLIKLYITDDGDIDAVYNIPPSREENKVGEIALMVFMSFVESIYKEYKTLMKALYTDEDIETIIKSANL